MWKLIKLLALLALIIVVTTFAVENQNPVSLTWYLGLFDDLQVPLYLLLYGSLIAGILLGLSIGALQRLSLWKKNRTLGQEVRRLTDEAMSRRIEAPASSERIGEGEETAGTEKP